MKPTFKTALWSVFFSTLVGLLMGCAKFELPAEKTFTLATEIANMMVQIPAGTFQMGDVFGEGLSPELPVHSVTLSAFKMSKHEISQAQWVAVMGVNPSNFNTCLTCPVEQVNWDDVQVFLTKLNTLTGKNYRLPTEAEWEYAAREGGKKVRFGNGKDILDATEANFNAAASYNQSYSNVGEYRRKTTPVGSFAPNALGLYDMTGNVMEWCSDRYGAYSSSSQTNPTGLTMGDSRVLRGGGWGTAPQSGRVASRLNNTPAIRCISCGVRLVLTQ